MRKADEKVATTIPTVQFQASTSHASSARGIPSCSWRAHWLTVTEFSRMMGREPQTIYTWLRNGTLAEFGIPVCHFRYGRLHSGRTFIQNTY